MNTLSLNKAPVVAVIGLGYVGLPLAVEFGKRFRTVGFDLSPDKVESYLNHVDPVGEISPADLRMSVRLGGLEPTTDPSRLSEADYLIVAVPTPVDSARVPDFRPLIDASEVVGAHMKPGATVIYESTVYPGATEEICIPVLERHSGMKWKEGFYVGYGIELTQWDNLPSQADALILAVAHGDYRSMPVEALTRCLSPSGIVIDVKGVLSKPTHHRYWRL